MRAATLAIPASALQQLVADIFDTAGCSRSEAERIALYLVRANLAGHDSHGVVRVPRYIQMKREGLILADQEVDLVVDTPALAVVDGKYGFGQTVAPQAVAIGIEKCQQMGLAAVALRHAGHIGRVADWAEMAAAEGLVSIHFVNAAGSVLVAPFGSVERRFSTAPYCVGVPLPQRAPLVLDFATSMVAEGKVLVASQGGKPIPADALIGPDGVLSDDPRLLYGEYKPGERRDIRKGLGALGTFGGHKGSGLALMCEILGGALSGTGCTSPGRRFANGMFSLYVDPARMDVDGMFPKDVTRYLAYVKEAKAALPGAETLLPGEPEARTRAQRLTSGVPLAEETWTLLLDTARSVGVSTAKA
jgi:hydroxycarboxylate dehydrogenase B